VELSLFTACPIRGFIAALKTLRYPQHWSASAPRNSAATTSTATIEDPYWKNMMSNLEPASQSIDNGIVIRSKFHILASENNRRLGTYRNY